MLMLNLSGALAAISVLLFSKLVSATCSFSMFWFHHPAFSMFWSFWSWTHDVLSSCLPLASSPLECQWFLPVTSSAAHHFHFQAQLQVSLDSFDSFSSVSIQHPLPSDFGSSLISLKQTDLDSKSWFAHWDSAICSICLLSTVLLFSPCSVLFHLFDFWKLFSHFHSSLFHLQPCLYFRSQAALSPFHHLWKAARRKTGQYFAQQPGDSSSIAWLSGP